MYEVFRDWSATAPEKFNETDCRRTWDSIADDKENPISLGTLIWLAKQYENAPNEMFAPPETLDKMAVQAAQFIDSLYLPGEHFELTLKAMLNDKGKYVPLRSESLLEEHTETEQRQENLEKIKQMISSCPHGAWISMNPIRAEITGTAPCDADVTSFRYTLIEADELTKEEQWAKIKQLHLPIQSVVWSGGKSLHVIVKIEAGTDRRLYDARVKALHEYLDRQQFPYDRANKNPSRLTRLPGVRRGGDIQYLAAGEFGPKTWLEFESEFLAAPGVSKAQKPSNDELQSLIERYGAPYEEDQKGKIVSINQSFFAGYTLRKRNLKRDPLGNWRMYQPKTGLWERLQPPAVQCVISEQLLDFSRKFNLPTLVSKRTANLCRDIRSFLDGEITDSSVFERQRRNVIHAGNCMLEIMPDGSLRQHPFAPEFGSCNSSLIEYNPEAECPLFLEKLLGPCMEADDMECFQLYFGQCLLGVNISQTFLMLTGTPQSGKSTLVNIVERIVGRSNCTELRLEQMAERFEMHRLLGKTLLTAKDVKSYFLNTKGAYRLKALTGRDMLTTEAKGSNETYDVSGDCNVIITANSNLTVDIDSDNEAWKRRMLWIRYECPPVKEKIDAFDDYLLEHEAPGILNWGIEGACKLIRNKCRIPRSEKQLQRINELLMESNSVNAFVETCLVQEAGASATMQELYSAYVRFCASRDW